MLYGVNAISLSLQGTSFKSTGLFLNLNLDRVYLSGGGAEGGDVSELEMTLATSGIAPGGGGGGGDLGATPGIAPRSRLRACLHIIQACNSIQVYNIVYKYMTYYTSI